MLNELAKEIHENAVAHGWWCKRSGACEKTEGSKNDVRRDVAES